MAPTANHNFAAPAVAFGLFALAITPFILATPVYATDDNDNHVEITVADTTQFERQGQLFKATANVTVKTVKPYGFNLTLQASNSDLTNTSDPTTKIASTPATTPMALNSDQWGYSLNSKATTFSRVPNLTQPAAVLADVTKAKPDGCQNVKQCTKHVTYAANVDTRLLTPGEYSTEVVYTATAKPKPAIVVEPTICKSGYPKNDCQVDIDPNMIPVKYTGSTTHAEWTSLSSPENAAHQGEWYNYNNKQWANAITVKPEALEKYKNQTKVVDQSDILGFWVYIPRYAYEVMRRDGTDKPVSAQNFLISFEKKTTPKRHPAACSEQGKDYREDCGLDRSYIKGKPSNQGTWATHPAFTFGSKELNGIWFAKFETTGTNTQPTVLPNETHIGGSHSGIRYIGGFYALAKTMGVNDPNNVNIGGNTWGADASQNNHHLAKFSSRMVNNNDWGAATYLSASKYGAGYNGVQINANGAWRHSNGYGTTGCGPRANGDTSEYNDSGILGTSQACGNADHTYNGTIGQLASTTNNPTGIYDMSGGGLEYVAAIYSHDLNNSNTQNFGSAAHPLYFNTYNITNLNSCTFATCGGQALYEINDGLEDIHFGNRMWNSQHITLRLAFFPLFIRGGGYYYGSKAGLFCVDDNDGNANVDDAFRVALAPAPHD